MNLVLYSIIAVCFGIHAVNAQESDRSLGRNKKRDFSNACVVVVSEKEYEDHREEEQPLECELRGKDLNGTHYKTIRVKGLKSSWAKKNKVESGRTTLYAANSYIDDETDELVIPIGEKLELGDNKDEENRKLQRKLQTVTKRVLVIRAVASDRSTTASESTLSDDIFGTSGDVLNLKSQYSRCSDGKLQFTPVTTNSLVGTDGVYTVNLPTTIVSGASDSVIKDAMVNKATADLGTLTNIADYVMLCLPPGTAGGWIAYAYVNYWLSVYNDVWCQYPSAQLHEVGHNLNLAHSNEGTEAYGDQSCMMGYSYGNDEGPVMCFNGPKTYQLGWYSQYHVDLPNAGNFNWNGNLIGIAEKTSASLTDKMIVRIITSTTDTYIHFNRMIGMNSGTVEGGNQVLVTTRSTGTGYAESNLVSKMSANAVYSIPNFNGSTNTLTITVISIVTTTVPGRANISIQFGGAAPTSLPSSTPTLSPTRLPTPLPTTARPTLSPTPLPTSALPTPLPTPLPTSALPTSLPTPLPTSASPTSPPTPLPTSALPTPSPTPLPTSALPTPLPTPLPTSASPTSPPTPFPTTARPTISPTLPPTPLPSSARPTSLPSPAPSTALPTPFPTPLPTTAQPTFVITPSPTTTRPSPLPSPMPTTSKPTTLSPTLKASCNNDGRCQIGEDCFSCPFDCRGVTGRYCCVGGACHNRDCNRNGYKCLR